MGCVYLATNRINGKQYVGQSVDFSIRKATHKREMLKGSQLLFHRAIRKYGFDSFDWEKLYRVSTKDVLRGKEKLMLNRWEKYYIKKLNAASPNGYNLTDGGSNGRPTIEVKQRISKGLLGHPVSEETKRKCSLALLGRKNPEHSANRGIKRSDQTRMRLRLSHLGHKHTQEQIEKIKRANTGKRRSQETIERMRLAWEKRRRSESLAV